MEMVISENLKLLSSAFKECGSTLYIVGGAVRNSIAGLDYSDIDICSNMLGDGVQGVCQKLGFDCKVVNQKLGTMLIMAGGEQYEYTPFRVENYIRGNHSPEYVEWTDDIKTDARRRDFTCNAIYYDILSGQIVDFYGGVKDIHKRYIKAIETPEFVFSSDGLRVLRLVRFSSTLGWKIDAHTFRVCKKMTYQLKYISGERKTSELKSIFTAHQKYGSQVNPIALLNKLKLYPLIVTLAGVPDKIDEKRYANICKCDDVIGAFVCALILTKYPRPCSEAQLVYDVQSIISNLHCGGDVKDLSRLVSVMFDVRAGKIDVSTVSKFVSLKGESRDILKNLFGLDTLIDKEREYRHNNIPLKLDELDIDNATLIKLVPQNQVSHMKNYLFGLCQNGLVKNTLKDLTAYVEQMQETLKAEHKSK